MNSNERLHAVMNYEPVDRGVYMEPWIGFKKTIDRWESDGYTHGEFKDYGFDNLLWKPEWYGLYPPFEAKTIEEDERYVVHMDGNGVLRREFKADRGASMPQFLRFPVETREDFRNFAREHLHPDLGMRLGENWQDYLRGLRDDPSLVLWVFPASWGGFFGPIRNLMGVQKACTVFYEDPVLLEEMMDVLADYVLSLTDQLFDHVVPDVFGFWEDMAYRNGPLIGPEMMRKYMLPRYKRVVEHVRKRGVKWISLDSDGQVGQLIPVWLEAGIDIIYPMEVAAGMDVVALRKEFGRDLRMLGGVAKRALAHTHREVDAEVERIRPVIEDGGYVATVDHGIPPDVSFDNLQRFLEKLREALGMDHDPRVLPSKSPGS